MTAPYICPGVRKLVAGLNAAGWPTCDSGDGTHYAEGMEGARPYPHVTIQLPSHRARHLVGEAEAVAVWLRLHKVPVGQQTMEDTPCIQATYDPGSFTAFIDVMHVDDSLLLEPSGAIEKGHPRGGDPLGQRTCKAHHTTLPGNHPETLGGEQ